MQANPHSDGRPLLFFCLVFLFSLPLWLAGALSGAFLLPGLPVSALGAFCPVLAAAFLVSWQAGRSGVSRLLARAFDWHRIRPKAWLVPALFLPSVPLLVTFAMLRARGAAPAMDLSPLAALAMFGAFFVAALGEELGWSGYALDPLQARLGALPAALAIGAVWAVWHFVPLAQAHRGIDWMAWWTLGTLAKRVIMVALYNNAGRSVFAVALFHAAGNLCELGAPAAYDPRISGLVFAGIAILTAIFFDSRTLIHSRLG